MVSRLPRTPRMARASSASRSCWAIRRAWRSSSSPAVVRKTFAHLLEERRAGLVLRGVDLHGDGRLGKMQFLRRARKERWRATASKTFNCRKVTFFNRCLCLSAGGIPSGPRRRIGSLSSE